MVFSLAAHNFLCLAKIEKNPPYIPACLVDLGLTVQVQPCNLETGVLLHGNAEEVQVLQKLIGTTAIVPSINYLIGTKINHLT